MRTARIACGLLAAAWLSVCVPVLAQPRVQFPTEVPSSGPVPGPAAAGPAPSVTLEGIQPPPAGFDPYATPGSTPPALFPQDPSLQYGSSGATFTRMRKLLQEVRLDYVFMPGGGTGGLGVNDAELSATFAFPFLYNTETPILVTPGFAMHYWDGPRSFGALPADLPPYTFDGYLDAGWSPQVTPWFGGELDFRIGVYSDFDKITLDSLRYTGSGYAVLSFSPRFKVKAGIVYLDRNYMKMLPAGGLIWTPNADVRFDILFPEPKITKRLTTIGNTEWWCYLRGEYGGDAWTIRRGAVGGPADGTPDSFDYNDIRFALGVEFIRLNGLTGLFEVGVAFERELRYESNLPRVFYLDTCVFLRGGLAY